jgi:hypothetical protein
MTMEKRLRKQEHRRGGGVVIVPDGGLPVVFVEGEGYQFDGLFYFDWKNLSAGQYCLLEGPPVDFSLTWDYEKPWLEALEIMKKKGAIYNPISAGTWEGEHGK